MSKLVKTRKEQPRKKASLAEKKFMKNQGFLSYYENNDLSLAMIMFLIYFRQTPRLIGDCCRQANIVRGTIHTFKKNGLFLELYNDILDEEIDFLEDVLSNKAKDGDLKAIEMLLKNYGKKRGYGDQMELSMKVADDVIFTEIEGDELDDSLILEHFENE